MKKKLSIYIIVILLSFITIFLISSNYFKNRNNRLNADVNGVNGASISLTCNKNSISVGETVNCSLTGNLLGATSVSGKLEVSSSNIEITSVSGSSNWQGIKDNVVIQYYSTPQSSSTFEIATFSIKGNSVGNSTITFNDVDSETKVNLGDSNFNAVEVSKPTFNISVTGSGSSTTKSSVNTLSSLSVSNTNISLNNLSTTVQNSITSVNISANPTDTKATVTGTGTKTLNVGTNTFNIVVTAEDGSTKTYTIRITRQNASSTTKSNVNTLNSLSVSNTNISLNNLSATVQNSVTSVNISANPTDTKATVTGTGTKTLNVGTNTFNIVVTAEDGSTKTYTVRITRQNASSTTKSSINTLKSLNVSNTNIGLNNLSTTVQNNVPSVNISAETTDSKAKVTGTGVKGLNVGTNIFNIVVTAENGNQKIYTIRITRKDKVTATTDYDSGSSPANRNSNNNSNNNSNVTTKEKKDNNSLLKELKINDKDITLSDDIFNYKSSVTNEIESLKVVAISKSDKAKVEISGEKNLKVGENVVNIIVTAEDGTVSNYEVIVTRKEENIELSSDSSLRFFIVGDYEIDFKSNVYEYDLKIKNEKKLDIAYYATDENADVVIKGNENLKNNSIISIIVTAEDGTKSEYNIVIKKSNHLPIIIIASLLLISLITFIIIRILHKKKNNKIETTENQEQTNEQVSDIGNSNFDNIFQE